MRADGEKVPHHFDQSLGVRKDDKELLAALDAALDKARPKIEEILKEEGIPLVTRICRAPSRRRGRRPRHSSFSKSEQSSEVGNEEYDETRIGGLRLSPE